VRDDFLSNYIESNGTEAICDYCGLDPEGAYVRCLPFDDLMDVIGEGVNWAYGSADNEGIPYESAEGGYAFPNSVFDTYDLVMEEVGIDAEEDVLKDVRQALGDQVWCRKDFYSLSLKEALHSGWEAFMDKVKYETRFLFTLPEVSKTPGQSVIESGNSPVEDDEVPGEFNPHITADPTDLPPGDPDFGIEYDRQDGIPVYAMLDAIGQLVRRLELTRSIETGTAIFRVRVAEKGVTLAGPNELGPPSRDNAKQPNRMSPAGIVMFYGAMDRETAIAETFEPAKPGANGKSVWVARFDVLRDLQLLDLTDLPSTPSIFDTLWRDLRNGISFLHDFVDDLVKPIERDGREHIDYVPTQIVTEYFRHRFHSTNARRLDGILYRSSKRQIGVACVLFFDGKNCGAPSEPWSEPEQALRLLDTETEVLDGGQLNAPL